ncbi:hypothetical protein [Thermoflexus sp.]|uniref:hypothetical protein n=1 Tax=Thermoflexus sp. TaxID=1969742 RepID=UPI0035E41E3F
MLSTKQVRWSGGALIVAGVILGIGLILHPDETAPDALAHPLWGPTHFAIGVGFLISLLGLIGVHARQAEKAGVLGLIGFVVSFVSSAALSGPLLLIEGIVLPGLAQSEIAEAALTPTGPVFGGLLEPILLGTLYAFGIGYVLFGIATIRAGVLPRWAAASLIAGTPLAIFTPPLPAIFLAIGGVLIGVAYLWLGYAVLSSTGEGMRESQPTMAKMTM